MVVKQESIDCNNAHHHRKEGCVLLLFFDRRTYKRSFLLMSLLSKIHQKPLLITTILTKNDPTTTKHKWIPRYFLQLWYADFVMHCEGEISLPYIPVTNTIIGKRGVTCHMCRLHTYFVYHCNCTHAHIHFPFIKLWTHSTYVP